MRVWCGVRFLININIHKGIKEDKSILEIFRCCFFVLGLVNGGTVCGICMRLLLQ